MRIFNKRGAMGIEKILLLYLCIAIACAFWQPSLIFDDGNSTLKTFFNLDYNSTTNEPTLPTCAGNKCLGNQFNEQTQNQTVIEEIFTQLKAGATYYIIDPLNNVIGIFKIIWNVLFSPFIIFTSPEMSEAPPAVFYIIALPLVLLLMIAIFNWIRSGIT